MCAIVGFVDYTKKLTRDDLLRMRDTLIHRGVDDKGESFYHTSSYNLALAHRRLAIVDLSALAHEPMQFDNLEIIYNGEVYNFMQIRKELIKCGYSFDSHSDVEVVLKAYHKWGIDAISRFNGMFAFVIYDKTAQTLTLVRDRSGIKPLYWYFKDGVFLFASELKAFYTTKSFHKHIDYNALALFMLYGYIPTPFAIFQNTHKLEAGHYMVFELKNATYQIRKYWDILDYANQTLDISFTQAMQHLNKLLIQAANYRMIADVRVGVFLSGGYDSSIVSAILANHKLDTFTIGFAKERYNEATYAREIAKYLHTNHHEHILNAKEALDIVSSIAYVYDEPFADSSAVATIAVSRLAKKDVKVAISADGADELFAGYNTYDVVLKYAKLKYFRSFIALLKIFKPFISNFDTRYDKLKYISHATSHATILKYLVHIFSLEDVHRLLPTFRIMPVAFDTDVSSLDSLSQLLSLDFKMYLMDDILTKVDRASMSVSLEAREVFLDYNIVQFVAQLPSSFKYGPTKKYILKELAYQYIPKELLHREKMGFGIPLEEWLRGEMKDLVYSYLNPHTLKQQNILLTDEVLRVRDDFYNHKHNNARKIWNLLMFGMFYEKWCKN